VIQGEIDVLGTERKIQSRVRKQMESNQRDYYLNEQMKSIQKELTPPKSSCFSAVLSDKLAIIISLKRSTSLPS
jgi:ATP-dependent Lon protease